MNKLKVANKPSRTLFVMVTCSRDTSRRDIAIDVTKNVAKHLADLNLCDRLLVFDNDSKYRDHLQYLPKGAKLCQSNVNYGYWTAINWVLEHLDELVDFQCDFIYPIESDLIHMDLLPLGMCELFLDANNTASSVRTQEFSVRSRWRYSKRLSWLPFHIERSAVSLRNAVNGTKSKFKKSKQFKKMYLSNLHPKLPGLQRVPLIKDVFEKLKAKGEFTEKDFFAEMMKVKPDIGMIDGGLWFAKSTTANVSKVISGSWSSKEDMEKSGYLTTRSSRIDEVENFLSISVV